jgi:hypothetical protein
MLSDSHSGAGSLCSRASDQQKFLVEIECTMTEVEVASFGKTFSGLLV